MEPKRQALAQANLELAAATEKLEAIRKKLAVSTGSNTKEVLGGGTPPIPLGSHLQTGPSLRPTAQEGIAPFMSILIYTHIYSYTHICLLQ